MELVLESEAGEIRVFREMGKAKRKSGPFYFIDHDGERHDGEEELWKLLGMDARDFMNSAYLHQEVIREIVVSDPSVREEALNRLLGISDLHNLSSSLKGIKAKRYEDGMNGISEELDSFIRARSSAYHEKIDNTRERGYGLGMVKDDFSARGLDSRCAKVSELVAGLAEKAGIEDVAVEAVEGAEGFDGFRDEAEKAVRRLRSENPGSVSQEKLYKHKGELEKTQGEYTSKAKNRKELLEEKAGLEKEGGLDELLRKKEELLKEAAELETELGKINARLPVIEATARYLEKLEDRAAAVPCPSGEQEIVPGEVLRRLEAVKAGMGEEAVKKSGKKRQISDSLRSLQKTIDRLKAILDDELPRAESEVRACREMMGKIVGREIGDNEDPEAIAKNRLAEIDTELERASEVLRSYNEEIDKVEDVLKEARLIWEMLDAQRKIATIERVTESPEWKAMADARDRLNGELEAVGKVKDAIDAVIAEVAEEKLQEAESMIKEYYQALVERPDFEAITIDTEDHDVYAVSGAGKEKIVTFFNQGDMNCAALSIFLSLGASAPREGGPAFLILDDPTQSLDSVQKRRLAALIDRVASERQIVLSTMDEELVGALREELTKAKKIYRLGEWGPVKGPSIREE
ncbi:MAG: hypothetical protein ACUVS1_10555 [Actinomycetota bacterium]